MPNRIKMGEHRIITKQEHMRILFQAGQSVADICRIHGVSREEVVRVVFPEDEHTLDILRKLPHQKGGQK